MFEFWRFKNLIGGEQEKRKHNEDGDYYTTINYKLITQTKGGIVRIKWIIEIWEETHSKIQWGLLAKDQII